LVHTSAVKQYLMPACVLSESPSLMSRQLLANSPSLHACRLSRGLRCQESARNQRNIHVGWKQMST